MEDRTSRKEEEPGGGGSVPYRRNEGSSVTPSSPSTKSRSSSASGPSMRPLPSSGPLGNFHDDSTSLGPTVGVKREEEQPLSVQLRPVVVERRLNTELSSCSEMRFPPISANGTLSSQTVGPRPTAGVSSVLSILVSSLSRYFVLLT